MSDAFISYSRVDTDTVRRIHDALADRGKNLWVDWEGIPKGVEFMEEIYRAIESADCFLLMISPNSARSEVCSYELAHAIKFRKRLIPVVVRDVPPAELPAEVAMINWIFIRDSDDFQKGIGDVLSVIETNPVWVRTHTRLLTQAIQWEAAERDGSLLLRGRELEKVEHQIGRVGEEDSPRPTALQRQFLAASRAHASRFWRFVMTSVSTALVAMLVLAVLLWFQKSRADQNARLAAEQADRYSRSTFSLQLRQVREELENRSFDLATSLLADEVRCPPPLRSFAWGYYLDQSRRQRACLQGHQSAVDCLALSADGRRIASSGDDHTVRLWDPSDLSEIRTLLGHQDEVWAVEFSPSDPNLLVSGSRDGVVQAWKLDTKQATQLRPHQVLRGSGQATAVTAIAFQPGGQRVAVSNQDGRLRLFDAKSWKRVAESKLDQRIFDLDWSDDGTLLAAACKDEKVHLWDRHLERHRSFPAHAGGVNSLSFLPQPLQLVSGGRDGKVRIWDGLSTIEAAGDEPALNAELDAKGVIQTMATSHDGTMIVWGSSVGSVHAWNRPKRQFTAVLRMENEDPERLIDQSIYSVCVLPGDAQVLSALHDGTIRLLQINDPSPELEIAPAGITKKSVHLNRTARLASIVTVDGKAFWRRLEQDQPWGKINAVVPPESPEEKVGSAAELDPLSTVGDPLSEFAARPQAFHVALSDDGTLVAPVFTRVEWLSIHHADDHAGPFDVHHEAAIGWAEFSRDSRLIATVDYSGLLVLTETRSGKLRASRRLGRPAYRMIFSSAGDQLFVSLADGSIEILATKKLRPLTRLVAPVDQNSATDLAFDQSRQRLMVTIGGMVYCTSNADDAPRLELFITADESALQVDCSTDGQIVATGHQDGTVRMWDASTGDLRGLIDSSSAAIAELFFHSSRPQLYVIDQLGTVHVYRSLHLRKQ